MNSKLRRILPIVFLVIFSLSLCACEKREDKAQKTASTLDIRIYTSLFVFEEFAKSLLAEAKVESLIPQGIDPHHFEPSLKDIQKLHQANLVIYLGDTDVDRWIDRVSKELTQRGVRIFRVSDRIALKPYKSSKELDPHIWLDPESVAEIVKALKDEITAIAPQRKEVIEKNYLTLNNKINELIASYRETLRSCQLKEVITTHEFLNYLGLRYGFSPHFIVHEPKHEPSLRRVRQLKEIIRKNSIEYIISEPEGERIAKALSKETGVKILDFDTFHTKSSKDYFSAMKENLRVLSEALRCKS